MNRKYFYAISMIAVAFGAIIATTQSAKLITSKGEDCSHSHVEHYDCVKPSNDKVGRLEHWACCDCHRAFYDSALTQEITGADVDRTIIDIAKTTTHSWGGSENVKNDEIINISTDAGDVECLSQTDWTNYSNGLGSGTYYYYYSDSHLSVYIDALSMSWKPERVTARDTYNGGYSTFKFNTSSLSSLTKFSFEYKYWDVSNIPDGNGNHVSVSTDVSSSTKYKLELVPDNKWHTISFEFPSAVDCDKLIFDIFKFNGELYMSNLQYNQLNIESGAAYDISVDSSWASAHVAQFGLPANSIPSSTELYPLSESAIKVVRNGTSYDAGNTGAPMITKDNANQYTVNTWWTCHNAGIDAFENGDVLVIEGTFKCTSSGYTYLLNVSKFEIIFVSAYSYTYAHYVNHSGDVLSDLATSTKTTYRWFMTTSSSEDSALDGYFKPTLASNFKLNGIDIANTSVRGLMQSSTDRGEICVLDTDQGFSALKVKGAKLVIEGYFVNESDSNNYIYISKTTFYCDGTNVARIPNDTNTSDFEIGIWNGNHHFTNDQALRDIAAAGVDTAYAVNPIWNSNWSHTMELANELGVQFYCDPRSWDSTNSEYADWDGTAPSWINNDAIAGVVAWDEPSTQEFSTIKNYKQQFDATTDGSKKMFVNLNCSAVSETALYGDEDTSTNDKYATAYAQVYANTYDADMYAFDSYGIMENGTKIRKSFYCDLDVWSHFSKQNSKDLYYTILLSGHATGDGYTYTTATLQSLRWKFNLGMAFGSKSIIHYVYANSDTDAYTCIADNDGNIINQDLYDAFSTANNEVKNWDEIYSQYTWEGYTTHDTGSNDQMFQKLQYSSDKSDLGISATSSDENLIIGSMKDSASQRAYMIVNAGRSTYSSVLEYSKYIDVSNWSMDSATTTITFDKTYSHVIKIHNGEKTLEDLNSNKLTISLSEYDGMFVIPF